MRKFRCFDLAQAVAAVLTVVLWIAGEIRWPLAVVLLVLCLRVVRWWEER